MSGCGSSANEVLHPETRHGENRHSSLRKVCEPSDRFTADTAEKKGRSDRSVQLDVERGETECPVQSRPIRKRWRYATRCVKKEIRRPRLITEHPAPHRIGRRADFVRVWRSIGWLTLPMITIVLRQL